MRVNDEVAPRIRAAFGPDSIIGRLPVRFMIDEWFSHFIAFVGVDPPNFQVDSYSLISGRSRRTPESSTASNRSRCYFEKTVLRRQTGG
jgi:hypothetical protein